MCRGQESQRGGPGVEIIDLHHRVEQLDMRCEMIMNYSSQHLPYRDTGHHWTGPFSSSSHCSRLPGRSWLASCRDWICWRGSLAHRTSWKRISPGSPSCRRRISLLDLLEIIRSQVKFIFLTSYLEVLVPRLYRQLLRICCSEPSWSYLKILTVNRTILRDRFWSQQLKYVRKMINSTSERSFNTARQDYRESSLQLGLND